MQPTNLEYGTGVSQVRQHIKRDGVGNLEKQIVEQVAKEIAEQEAFEEMIRQHRSF